MLQTAMRQEGLALTSSNHEALQTRYSNRQYIFYDYSNNILRQTGNLCWQVFHLEGALGNSKIGSPV